MPIEPNNCWHLSSLQGSWVVATDNLINLDAESIW